MTSAIFKKTLFISLLGHITVFSIFSFTFGNRMTRTDYTGVSFLGSFLRDSDFSNRIFMPSPKPPIHIFKDSKPSPDTTVLEKANKGYILLLKPYFKPPISSFVPAEKTMFKPIRESLFFLQRRKDPIIMLYPPLPYHFLLYFKDRQRAHIELAFNIILRPKDNTILIKRKVSSGNLEADLLSMRYISHYLFIQQARFIPNTWQTVKIDLSAKED